MKTLLIKFKNEPCGILKELTQGQDYQFEYLPNYKGSPISLTLPIQDQPYTFRSFPAFFDGLLPEGIQLDALLRQQKIDEADYMAQLAIVGQDLVGAITAHPIEEN